MTPRSSRSSRAAARPSHGAADREPLDARIASLVSELDALRTELRELSEANRGSTASLVRRDPSSQGPWPEAWFVEHPGDVSSRLLRAGDRLAELSRNLARVEEAVRRAREARALPGAPGNSLSGDEPGSAAASQDGMPLLPLPGARLSPAARRTPGAPPSGTPSRRKHARRRKTHGEPRASGKIGPGAIPNLLVPPREPFRSPVTTFLRSNRTEGFDIQTLNALPLSTLVERTRGDRAVIDAIAGQADELMARVKHDIDDPESAAALLRDQVRYWLRESAKDPAWTARMPDRWAGLFADSREHGGRLRRWLGDRLWTLRQEAVRGGSLGARLRRSLGGRGAKMKVVVRDAPEEIRGEVAQAILDDLSTHPHDPAAPLPLIALSELAQRRQVVTVNDALGQLFSAPDGGSFVILHPNRYPDCPEVVIRPPSPRAKGAALAYTMGLLRPPAAPAAGTPSVLGPAISATAASAGPSVDPGADAETVW